MFHLWPELSSFFIAPQFPWRSGQIFGGGIGIKCGGNGDRPEAAATLGNCASSNAISASGQLSSDGGALWDETRGIR